MQVTEESSEWLMCTKLSSHLTAYGISMGIICPFPVNTDADLEFAGSKPVAGFTRDSGNGSIRKTHH